MPKKWANRKYIVAEVAMHTVAIGGTAIAACAILSAGCATALGVGSTAVTATCSDDGCAGEAATIQQGLNVFAKASECGIRTYNQLRDQLSGTGLRAHYIIEKRFADILGVKQSQMLSVALTPEEHQLFTNAWKNAIGYSNSNSAITTLNATKEQIWLAAPKIYANYPELLEAARQTLFGK